MGTLWIVPIYCAAPREVSFYKGAQVENRFETFPDPFNNWIVWDLEKDDFAEVDNQRLQCLSEAKAHELCAVLNSQESRMAA
jgi:hypothetical protein